MVAMSQRTLVTLVVLVLLALGGVLLSWGVVDTVQAQPTGEEE
jgi:hypothetical protein